MYRWDIETGFRIPTVWLLDLVMPVCSLRPFSGEGGPASTPPQLPSWLDLHLFSTVNIDKSCSAKQFHVSIIQMCDSDSGLPWLLNGCIALRSALLGSVSCMHVANLEQRNHDQACNRARGHVVHCVMHQCATQSFINQHAT